MNVNDFDIEIPEGDMLETIFAHQRQLMDKYHAIEEANVGHSVPSTSCVHGPHCGPLNLQDRASQLQLKSFAWRITEELTEATASMQEKDYMTHYLEELIDALHFSVELCIMSDVYPAYMTKGDRLEDAFLVGLAPHEPTRATLRYLAYMVIEKLGEAMNRLKLKPWKTTAMLTDESLYKQDVMDFFSRLIVLLKASGMTARSATAMYLNKNAVNQFRIRSNY